VEAGAGWRQRWPTTGSSVATIRLHSRNEWKDLAAGTCAAAGRGQRPPRRRTSAGAGTGLVQPEDDDDDGGGDAGRNSWQHRQPVPASRSAGELCRPCDAALSGTEPVLLAMVPPSPSPD